MITRCILSAAALLAFAAPADAVTLLSNGPSTNAVTRSDAGLGEAVAVSIDTTLTNIGFYTATPTGGNLKYVIFDASGSTLLFSIVAPSTNLSSTVALAFSPTFNFNLVAGSTYRFGVLGDKATQIGYIPVASDVPQNGLVTVGYNVNFSSYAAPVVLSTGGAKGVLVLQGVQGTVPEPASWALMLAGFGVIGGAMRYRLRATAAAA